MNIINLWRSRLWTSGLGQGEVPEMLVALWRAQPGGVRAPSHVPGEGGRSTAFASGLPSPKLVENTSRKIKPTFHSCGRGGPGQQRS